MYSPLGDDPNLQTTWTIILVCHRDLMKNKCVVALYDSFANSFASVLLNEWKH